LQHTSTTTKENDDVAYTSTDVQFIKNLGKLTFC